MSELAALERHRAYLTALVIEATLPSRMLLLPDGTLETMPPAPVSPLLTEALGRLDRRIAELRQWQS